MEAGLGEILACPAVPRWLKRPPPQPQRFGVTQSRIHLLEMRAVGSDHGELQPSKCPQGPHKPGTKAAAAPLPPTQLLPLVASSPWQGQPPRLFEACSLGIPKGTLFLSCFPFLDQPLCRK